MSLATKLITLRKQKGLTQMKLAEKLHVSRQAISRWEVGAAVPSTDNLKILGELYGVPIDYLLNDNVVYSCGSDETEEVPNEQQRTRKRNSFILVCILIVVIAIGISIIASYIQKEEKAFPMNDMDTVEENHGYSTETFLID